MIRTTLVTAAFLATLSTAASGGVLLTLSETETTQGYAGVNLVFGSGGVTREAVLGVTHGTTDTSNDVTGANASVHFGLGNGFGLRAVKLTGLSGDVDQWGELGLGYNFGSGSVFGVGAFADENLRAGVDLGFDGFFQGYVGLQSFDAFDPRGEEPESLPRREQPE
ncbi:MAG: hypothetical protein RI538_01820 [Salibaculum sp.]|uniref:hypothetical protein n=1 Tax=Salibaculum sp. TaxID=2855480 RepID=UPI002870A8A9|nr:hypothetical protein [Salibaculum sp.]MDR9427179.1 hypothetical protein [Salibaculum sp.]MDR9481505.1 hypothetical protein [Salibaculum sp.]